MTISINGTGPIIGSDRASQGANSDITSLNSVTSINGGQLAGFRNKIINGSMIWDQRNSGAAVTPSVDGSYLIDRWRLGFSQASKLTVQQVADAPPGFQVSTKVTVAASVVAAAGNVFVYSQYFEGLTTTDMQYGLATAQTITISFYVKCSVPGTYSVALRNAAGNRSYIFTYVATAGWTRVSTVVPGDTTGTWNIGGANLSMKLEFDLGTGSSAQTTPNSWQGPTAYLAATGATSFVSQVNGSTLNITGVQLEIGSVATPFEQKSIGIELVMCQRYFNRLSSWLISGYAGAGTAIYSEYAFPVGMRATPTSAIGGATYSNASAAALQPNGTDKMRFTCLITALGFGYADTTAITFNAEL